MNPSATERQGPDIEGARGVSIPLARPWVGDAEADAAHEIIRSRWLVQGPRVAAFEDRFAEMLGARHAVAVNSGSSALLVAMAALGVGRDDEVIVPDMTFVSTGSAALFLGARPVFVDLESTWWGMDPDRLEDAITPRTRAIVPVHYAGHSAEMGPILEIAKRHGVPVLEDAAESHLSRYQGDAYSGTLGEIGIFSFTPSKPMTTGEGGMIVTNDDELADACRRFRNFGDTGKFQWDTLGFNFRLPEPLGAVGLAQLDRLPEAVRLRREIGRRYTERFRPSVWVETPRERTPEDHNYQLYTMLVARDCPVSRDDLQAGLRERGVGSRVYYPAMHHQGVFAHLDPPPDAAFPVASDYERRALSLPIYPELDIHDQNTVIDAVLDILGSPD